MHRFEFCGQFPPQHQHGAVDDHDGVVGEGSECSVGRGRHDVKNHEEDHSSEQQTRMTNASFQSGIRIDGSSGRVLRHIGSLSVVVY